MPDKEYNQEEQEYLIHRQELKYLMDKYPEDFKDWNDEEEPYSFFDVLKDTAKMGGMAGIIGLEKIGVNTGPIIQKARKYFNEGGIVEENSPTFALGGLATARKGITTEEGKEMADKRFQLDEKKADLNNDNKLSDYEKQRGETVQKAMKMYHGGMPCGCEGGDDCDCGGGMMSDPVSGNPIPIGSSAENVRDDIEAMISEGEYVLPANVVKWHGLKHIMDMQSEAEMGLMGMYDMGLIQYAGEEAEDPEEESEAQEDVPSEDVEVEVATVEVDDMLDDEEDGEISPSTSKLPGMVSKPKLMIMS